ncbi:hypothetical protein V1512DRAFT_145940 [Lipomyces arxii]|uniref:uncharacterized protein n=1 Tax=Lipomyces arxii TaxID=56418 RepID=UPI0034CE2168
MEDEKIQNFCAFTDADPELAKQYLAVSDGDLDRAVGLFLETGGAALDGGSSRGSGGVSSGLSQNPVIIDDDEDDATMAERLQMEENQRRQSEVRERIAPRTETLVEDYGYYPPPEMSARVAAARPSVFNQTPEGLPRDTTLTDKQSRLEQLFRPPWDIMSKYNIDTAKIKGREMKKWLLVNVQDVSDFQCQVLNRDFWSNENVKETVRENFLFMQYSKDTYEGQNFLQYYPATKFPYLAILDPRTGEQMKIWNEIPSPEDWIVSVYEFLDRFSLDPKSRNPIGKMAKHKPVERMSEEEQLKFALEQSMGGSAGDDTEEASEMSSVSAAGSAYDSMDDVSSSSPRDKGKRKIEVIDLDEDEEFVEAEEELTPLDAFAEILPVSRPEPDADPKTTTRIQIRLADGSRRVRRVNLSDPIRSLFEYIKANIPELRERHFQIVDAASHKKLIEILDDTIEQAGLKNSVVLVEVDDEE